MTVPEGNATILPKGNYGKLVLTPLVALLDKAILNQFVPVPVKRLVLASANFLGLNCWQIACFFFLQPCASDF